MTTLAPIEPLRSWPTRRYQDGMVTVEPGASVPGGARAPGALAAWRQPGGRITVRHGLGPADIDDELAEPLAAALAPLTDDHEVFKRAFTGLVLTSQPSAREAWDLFYRNSLARLWPDRAPGYAPVYRRALRLLDVPHVADLGCGFGLLALHLARRGTAVTACDTELGAVALLRRAARGLRLPVRVLAGDARRAPLAAESVDAVVLLHVLEHVDGRSAAALLCEARRVARDRVVVAVPCEPRPTRLFGHVTSITPARLGELGAATGWRYQVFTDHGGWLVLDRPHTMARRRLAPPSNSWRMT